MRATSNGMGAAGYITKNSSRAELARAVKKVIAGGRYGSSELGEALATDLDRDSEGPPHQALSDRRFEVNSSARTGPHRGRDCAAAVHQRSDREYLPIPNPEKDGRADQRRADPLPARIAYSTECLVRRCSKIRRFVDSMTRGLVIHD